MKTIALIASVAALAVFAASPAYAAKKKRARGVQHAAVADNTPGFQGGVMKGPLYNGQDYLGDDPDPNIRSYILRDLGMRYGQSH
jgi:hypothetical protein